MLGTRTKQVNSYGRRGSRIVNVSERRDRESTSSSASDVDTLPPRRFLRRENAIMISPAKPRVARRLQGSSRSPRSSPLAQRRKLQLKATQDITAKRIQSKLEPSTHVRQPLTPLHSNGTSSNEQPPSAIKGKSKAAAIKPARATLKLHVPVIAVDIIVLDEDGNTLKEERRLSHTDIQANQVRTAIRKGKKVTRMVPPSPQPISISDDSDPEVASPQPVIKRLNKKIRAIIISSDESEASEAGNICTKPTLLSARSQSRSKSQRVEVVIPPTPYRKRQVFNKAPSSTPFIVTPPKTPALRPHFSRLGPAAIPSLLAPPIPPAKPRQLTPIRGGSSRSIFRPPPTPSTPSEADLSLDLAQLELSDATEVNDLAPVQPEYLIPLLNECAQTSPYEFSAFIETFPFDPIVQSSAEGEDARFRKIGEASYSEVFGIGDVVLKIIPIRFEGESAYPEADEIPAPSDAKDVLKEIIVTRDIGEICDNFIRLLKTYVVRGRYPSLLLDLWDEYNERKGSESIRPDSFGLTQVYAIIILPNGGPDLESFAFKNVSKAGWHQACGIFWQVARSLEQAEHLVKFEHRDLHWGQILVKSVPVKRSTSKCPISRVAMDDTRFGVKVTIIDLGLSRMSAVDTDGSKIYWTPFDAEIFEGEGDYQYDIYRMMRDLVGGAWKSFHPFTNVMWLHYLVTKLLHAKRLKLPGDRRQTGGGESRVVSPTGYDEQECYDCLSEMERLLGDCIATARKRQKALRKTMAPSSGPKSARDVIAYGKQRGWIR